MGITRLLYLLREKCPKSIRSVHLSHYRGKIFALDASVTIQQYLKNTKLRTCGFAIEHRDVEGNLTGHLLDILDKTIMLLEYGIRPVWVFDGKQPEIKVNCLKKRKERQANADKVSEESTNEEGELEKLLNFANQTIEVEQGMINEVKKLLQLLGMPIIDAPYEADVSCSILSRDGKVYATAVEDMDTLAFGCPILIRELSTKEENVTQIKLERILEGLELNMDEFIDLCILCGCDYCGKIEGIGCVKAYQLIKEYKNIEKVIDFIDKFNKDPTHLKKIRLIKEDFDYDLARKIFKNPKVVDTSTLELKFNSPNLSGLKEFLIKEKNFNESKIDDAIKRLINVKNKTDKSRIEEDSDSNSDKKEKQKEVSSDKHKKHKHKSFF